MLFFNQEKTMSFFYNRAGELVEVGPYFEVTYLVKKIPDKCEPEEIEIMFQYEENNPITFRIPLGILADQKEFQAYCFKNYFNIKSGHSRRVLDTIVDQMQEIQKAKIIKYENKQIGWYIHNGVPVFLMDETILPDGCECSCIRDMGRWKEGDETIYDEMLEKYVYPNYRMSLAYILGFSGVLVARITKNRDLGVMLTGISGQTTTGKTTAIKLMASIWGDPDNKDGRIIMKSDASNIGFNAQFAGFNGPCIIFDDVDQNETLSLENKLNSLSCGTQRTVSDTKGDVKNRMGFGGICIFASETSLLDKTRKEGGLYVRYADFQDIVWTDDSASAEFIKQVCNENFGFKGKKFARFIEEKSTEQLLAIYDASYKYVNDCITKQDQYSQRINKKYAIIIATAHLLMDCFGISFNIEKIMNIITNVETESQKERNKEVATYEYIKEFFITNHTKFNLLGEEKQLPANGLKANYGIAVFKGGKLHLYIPVDKTDEILCSAGFRQWKNYRNYWKKNGLIQSPTDRTDSSASSVLYARHYHFVYDDFSGVIKNYIYVFKDNIFTDINPIYRKNYELLNQISPNIDAELNGENPEVLKMPKPYDPDKEYRPLVIDDDKAIGDIFKEDESDENKIK